MSRRRLITGAGVVLPAVALLAWLGRNAPAPSSDHTGRTPAIPRAIEALEAVEIGGLKQWLLIRGRDRAKPVLLWLHGGPGSPTMPLAHRYDGDLIDHAVVVHWDQRGAGKSYDPAVQVADLTLERYLADAREVVLYLRARLGAATIHLVGHSWGAFLGLMMARRHPDLIESYIGVGQALGLESFRVGYATLVERARVDGDERAIREIAALGAPPWTTLDQLASFGAWNHHFGGIMRQPPPDEGEAARSPYAAPRDAEGLAVGAEVSVRATLANGHLMHHDLAREIARLEVPVAFFQGRHDNATSSIAVERYYQALEAPRGKRLVWFEDSAHFPMYEEPARFNQELSRALRADAAPGA
jgi:pimeloyl-ACP methyl ester carboxylesterase